MNTVTITENDTVYIGQLEQVIHCVSVKCEQCIEFGYCCCENQSGNCEE